EIVAEQDATARTGRHSLENNGEGRNVLAVNFNQGQRAAAFRVDCGMNRFDQGAFSHAASAPQQGIVGRQSTGETPGVFQQDVAYAVDSLQQGELDAAYLIDALDPGPIGMPIKGFTRGEIRRRRRFGCQTSKRLGNSVEERKQLRAVHSRQVVPGSAFNGTGP